MAADSLYGAAVTTVPIIFLTLIADGGTLFGPTSPRPRIRWLDLTADILFVVGGLATTIMAIVGLAQIDPPDLRAPVAWSLGFTVFAAFMHVLSGTLAMYVVRPPTPPA